MKHWDGLEAGDAAELRLSRRDRHILAEALGARRAPVHIGSLVGLLLSLGLLAGLAWALAPQSPVAPEVRRPDAS